MNPSDAMVAPDIATLDLRSLDFTNAPSRFQVILEKDFRCTCKPLTDDGRWVILALAAIWQESHQGPDHYVSSSRLELRVPGISSRLRERIDEVLTRRLHVYSSDRPAYFEVVRSNLVEDSPVTHGHLRKRIGDLLHHHLRRLTFGQENLYRFFIPGALSQPGLSPVPRSLDERPVPPPIDLAARAVREYLDEGDKGDLLTARSMVFRGEQSSQRSKTAAAARAKALCNLCDFFEKWARLVQFSYLPLLMFDGPSGDYASHTLLAAKNDIRKQRRAFNVQHSRWFAWLVGQIARSGFLAHWHPDKLDELDRLVAEFIEPFKAPS